ncbi:MAG: HU family DNA-binding protein [Bacteroidota bacterium]|jgi:DNA-binding protein HU-beta|nr:HU family DNA-binding protein [Bacteroidota bacterium]MED5269312.1 HU family DNA-binding protein [Bacteroidota bacterium]|tara:strand:- start:84 stop:374 length:291 start_codon:yes stop_codon:yes gene_type:complete
MTKADIVKNISDKTGMDKSDVQMIAEKLMNEIKNSLKNNENVYLRGFGSFIVKTRAEKTGRNISKNVAVVIPAHNIPAFKPSKTFVNSVKQNVPIV